MNSEAKARYSHWQHLYETAVLETHPEKLHERIAEAEQAIFARMQALNDGPEDRLELGALEHACNCLLVIETDMLAWPSVGRREFQSQSHELSGSSNESIGAPSERMRLPDTSLLNEVQLRSTILNYSDGLVKRSGMDLEAEPSDLPLLPPDLEAALSRIVQEASANGFAPGP